MPFSSPSQRAPGAAKPSKAPWPDRPFAKTHSTDASDLRPVVLDRLDEADIPDAPNLRVLPDYPEPRRVLFLQTDWEMGMCRVAREMRGLGHHVEKIAFHTADFYFALWGIPVTAFRRPRDQWRAWLRAYCKRHAIDTLVLYNDQRNYNIVAKKVAQNLGISVVVMEQGLVRPLHVTAYSCDAYTPDNIRQSWDKVLSGAHDPSGFQSIPPQRRPVSTAHKIGRFTLFASLSTLTRFLFPHYQEQQPLSARYHATAHVRGLWRYWQSRRRRRHFDSLVTGVWSGRYFLVPLQVPYDKQIVLQSPFDSMDDFLDRVADSFDRAAAPGDKLLIKAHPIDRGYRNYGATVAKLKRRLGRNRVHFVDHVPLGPLIENSRGVVTINSTVGLTALRHGAPVKTLGNAIYDLPELTFSGSLDHFWHGVRKPSRERVETFVRLLESTIQGRGSLARKCFDDGGQSGIIWPKSICEIFGFKQY